MNRIYTPRIFGGRPNSRRRGHLQLGELSGPISARRRAAAVARRFSLAYHRVPQRQWRRRLGHRRRRRQRRSRALLVRRRRVRLGIGWQFARRGLLRCRGGRRRRLGRGVLKASSRPAGDCALEPSPRRPCASRRRRAPSSCWPAQRAQVGRIEPPALVRVVTLRTASSACRSLRIDKLEHLQHADHDLQERDAAGQSVALRVRPSGRPTRARTHSFTSIPSPSLSMCLSIVKSRRSRAAVACPRRCRRDRGDVADRRGRDDDAEEHEEDREDAARSPSRG